MSVSKSAEESFVYTAELPSLQEMASCQVALAIWKSYMSRCSTKWSIASYVISYIEYFKWYRTLRNDTSFVEFFKLYCTYQEDTDTLVESLKTPRRIEIMLKASLKKIRNEMVQYFRFFREFQYCESFTLQPHWCVWLPNGKMDLLRTAEMMVSPENNELNSAAKVALMYKFCMVENLKTIPLDLLPSDVVQELSGYDLPYSYNLVPYLTEDRSEEINTYNLVTNCNLYDGIGGIRINQFWNRLNDDEQVLALHHIIAELSDDGRIRETWEAIEPAIGSMSWNQQQRLLAMPETGSEIIISSCKYSSSSKCAVWAWKHRRDLTTGADFSKIMFEILEYDDDLKNDAILTAVKLWDMAYDDQKNTLVNTDWYFERILYLCEFCADYTSAAFILLKKSLELQPMKERKALIMKYSIKLAFSLLNPDYIREIFDLYLPHIDDQIEFQKSVLNSEEMTKHCTKLWNDGSIDILYAIVEFYCNGDTNSIRKYCQNLFSELTYGDTFSNKFVTTDAEKWGKCCKLLDKIFHGSDEALVAKRMFVLYCLEYGGNNGLFRKKFHQVIKAVESVFSNEVELKRVKTEFIKTRLMPYSFRGLLMREDICDDVYFHSMIEWCCDGNEAGIVQLKKKIRTHDIMFDIVFFQLNKVYELEATGLKLPLLTRLDKYLSWYLANDDHIMAYKMYRVKKFKKLRIFSAINERRDEQSLKVLLEWFFGGDETKIRDFRTKRLKF